MPPPGSDSVAFAGDWERSKALEWNFIALSTESRPPAGELERAGSRVSGEQGGEMETGPGSSRSREKNEAVSGVPHSPVCVSVSEGKGEAA